MMICFIYACYLISWIDFIILCMFWFAAILSSAQGLE